MEKEWNKVIKIIAVDVIDGLEREFSYKYEKVIGNGSFGIVCEVIDVKSNETLAIKKVFQDRGYQVYHFGLIIRTASCKLLKLSHIRMSWHLENTIILKMNRFVVF